MQDALTLAYGFHLPEGPVGRAGSVLRFPVRDWQLPPAQPAHQLHGLALLRRVLAQPLERSVEAGPLGRAPPPDCAVSLIRLRVSLAREFDLIFNRHAPGGPTAAGEVNGRSLRAHDPRHRAGRGDQHRQFDPFRVRDRAPLQPERERLALLSIGHEDRVGCQPIALREDRLFHHHPDRGRAGKPFNHELHQRSVVQARRGERLTDHLESAKRR